MSKMKGNMNEMEVILNEAKEICEADIFHNINLIFHIISLFIGFVGFLAVSIFIFLGANSFVELLSRILYAIPLSLFTAMLLAALLDILFNIHAKSSKQEILTDMKELLSEKLGYRDIDIIIKNEISEPSFVILYGHAVFKTDYNVKTSEIIVVMDTLDHILCVKVRDPNTVIYDSCSC